MDIADKREMDFGILTNIGLEPLGFEAGQTIIEQDTTGHEMYLVHKGRVAIVVNGAQVEEVGAGGVFGEMGLIDGSPRSASVLALEPSEVVPVTERTFLYLIHETPYFALDVMRTLTARVRHMNEKILTL
ncbi:cyclic nucleotide-binding domain-containing protein [Pelagibius litoralis]|uniref:Cyclic nucleotide-binding domain-containing protein n=1 Tax=Pelagibius litoralis TaxID=374515 RepID=A0A967F2F1_9PROT|nr:cyclic nucleotide-binding domain-containing protein [Pelagibius litoralis]NIA71797.1 cyclic nucleotide-binding domain-containing protein [Pelagibius litoralis]